MLLGIEGRSALVVGGSKGIGFEVSRPSAIGMLKTVADEYARYGITGNTVTPGWIETQNRPDISPVIGSKSTVDCTGRRSDVRRRTRGNPWCT